MIDGGDNPSVNHHVASEFPCEVRAVDFVVRDGSGKTYRGLGDTNDDYYCYHQLVLAPADGTVAVVIDGVPDNQPGKINPFAAAGNTVILDHATHEYSALLHLEAGSITVKVGDRVRAGEPVGKCGNSGNSSGPHLHLHLMNSVVPIDATGFPVQFEHVWLRRQGEAQATLTKDYTPLSGDWSAQDFDNAEHGGDDTAR